jgi:hypothetical protein
VQGNAHRNLPRCGNSIQKRKDDKIMRNNYEASEVFEFGKAHEVVLGQKPVNPLQVDSIYGSGFQTEAQNDIDESEE